MSRSQPHLPRRGAASWRKVNCLTVALLLAASLLLSLTGPVAAEDTAAAQFETGWRAADDGATLMLDLEDIGALNQVDLAFVGDSTTEIPEGCETTVEAETPAGWQEIGRAALTAGSTQQTIPLTETVTSRIMLSLDACDSALIVSLLDEVAVNVLTQVREPVLADFDSDPAGFSPYPWNTAVPAGGTVTVETPDGGDSQAMVLRHDGPSSNASAWTFVPRTNRVELTARLRVEDTDATSLVGLRDQTALSNAVIGVSEGWLIAQGEVARTELVRAEPRRYYDIGVALDPAARTFDVSVDGEVVAAGLRTRGTASSVNNVVVVANPGNDGFALDDVVVRTIRTTPVTRRFTGPFDGAPLTRIGTLPEPGGPLPSGWSIGAETLDRDFADFSAYADDLAELGIPNARLQGGWARTEAVPGTYDWAWLDEAVDGLVARGVEPWLEFSYGNPAIPDGGTAGLGGAIPTGEGLEAFLDWVDAMVERYGDRVSTWYVWNEPQSSTVDTYSALVAETAFTVTARQPEARLVIGNTAGLNSTYARDVLRNVEAAGALDLIDVYGYHGYSVNPDAHYAAVEGIRAAVDAIDPRIEIMQTENGAPSQYWGAFALSNHPWTEESQAKWDLRRMLGDRGRGIDTNVFTISDLRYVSDGGAAWNPKGLLQVDGAQQVVRRKAAYRAVQATATLFDAQMQLADDALVRVDADRSIAAFGYRSAATQGLAVSYWFSGQVPDDYAATVDVNVVLPSGTSQDLVVVDMLDGSVYQVLPSRIQENADGLTVQVPAFDSPLVVAERSAVGAIDVVPDPTPCPPPPGQGRPSEPGPPSERPPHGGGPPGRTGEPGYRPCLPPASGSGPADPGD